MPAAIGTRVSAAGGRAGQSWLKALRQAVAALGNNRQAWASVQPKHAEVSDPVIATGEDSPAPWG